jgi:hypothetical protein
MDYAEIANLLLIALLTLDVFCPVSNKRTDLQVLRPLSAKPPASQAREANL